ncbi:Chymotrypsinogen B2 [Smittium culicis]|uniref:Chymotrypsinogen B2 n=1 Tax=Smittium culicis TaxID=133412 RepID=A0A1R1XXS9_9FUNG|nr:Chymotrypsinogen B2 [Smittium culicis]
MKIPFSIFTLIALFSEYWAYEISIHDKPVSENDTPIEAFIINGVPAKKAEYPFISQLYVSSDKGVSFGFSCTGSLIADQYVVTAAHCIYDDDNKQIKNSELYLNIGSDKLATSADIPKFYKVTKIYTNNYISNNDMDIALLKLDKKVTESVATPVKVYPYKIFDNLPVDVAGFGVTNVQENKVSNQLMKTSISVSSSSQCKKFNPRWINNSGPSVCSISQDGNDSCQGDSGGPMVTKINNTNTLVGLTSWGQSMIQGSPVLCGDNTIAYYTRAAYFVIWIASIIGVDYNTLIQL